MQLLMGICTLLVLSLGQALRTCMQLRPDRICFVQRRTPLAAFQRLLEDRAPSELQAFAALTHMLSDKLPPAYARQLSVAGTDTAVALVAALGMPVR